MNQKLTWLVLVGICCLTLGNPQPHPIREPPPGQPGRGPPGPPPEGPCGPGGPPAGPPPPTVDECKDYENSVWEKMKSKMDSGDCEDMKECRKKAVSEVDPPEDTCKEAAKKFYKIEQDTKSGNNTSTSTSEAP